MSEFLLFAKRWSAFAVLTLLPALLNASQSIFIENNGQLPDAVYFDTDLSYGHAFFEAARWKFVLATYDESHDDCTNGSDFAHHSCGSPHQENGLMPPNRSHVLAFNFVGADSGCRPQAEAVSSHYYNYFRGNDPDRWASRCYAYERLTYADLYPGVDLIAYEHNGHLKYDYRLQAGADAGQILLDIDGADGLRIDKRGHVQIATSVGEFTQRKPIAWQFFDEKKQAVAIEYALDEAGRIGFVFPEGYDLTRKLIIDPLLVFSTYTGSNANNYGFAAAFDMKENSFAAGIAFSQGYPTTEGAFNTLYSSGVDMSISKFSADGGQLLFSTYLGGTNDDYPHSLVVDNDDNLVIYGSSHSDNFPVTTSGYATSNSGYSDIVLTKLSADGTVLIGSTYYGGQAGDGYLDDDSPLNHNYNDRCRGEVQVGTNDKIYLAGVVKSSGMATVGAYQEVKGSDSDGIIACFNSSLSSLEWATYYGGDSEDAAFGLRINNNGIYVTGGTRSSNLSMSTGVNDSHSGAVDGYVARFSLDGSALLNSTFLGTDAYDQGFLIEVDRWSNVYVFGQSEGTYPSSVGAYVDNPDYSRQFIHKLNKNLTLTVYAAKFGSSLNGTNLSPTALGVDFYGRASISGFTTDNYGCHLPTPFAVEPLYDCIDGKDFYMMTLSPAGSEVEYYTFFGGSNSFDHVDGGMSRFSPRGYLYQAACVSSDNSDFPITPGVWSTANNADWNMAVFKIYLQPKNPNIIVPPVSISPGVNVPIGEQTIDRPVRPGTVLFGPRKRSESSAVRSVAGRLHLWPNPGTDELVLDIGSLLADEVQLFDAAGCVQRQFDLVDPAVRLDVGHLPAGTYLVQLLYQKQPVAVEKWLKLD